MRTMARVFAGVVSAALAAVAVAPVATARPTWDTSPVSVERDVSPQPRVLDARVATHPTYDRVVIDLRGELPGYDVRYVSRLRYDGSGHVVPLHGKRFLGVVLTPAKAHDAAGDSVYTGPTLQQYRFPVLRGIALTGDFEGQVSLGISARKRADFRVSVLHHPQRIIIDLRH